MVSPNNINQRFQPTVRVGLRFDKLNKSVFILCKSVFVLSLEADEFTYSGVLVAELLLVTYLKINKMAYLLIVIT